MSQDPDDRDRQALEEARRRQGEALRRMQQASRQPHDDPAAYEAAKAEYDQAREEERAILERRGQSAELPPTGGAQEPPAPDERYEQEPEAGEREELSEARRRQDDALERMRREALRLRDDPQAYEAAKAEFESARMDEAVLMNRSGNLDESARQQYARTAGQQQEAALVELRQKVQEGDRDGQQRAKASYDRAQAASRELGQGYGGQSESQGGQVQGQQQRQSSDSHQSVRR